MTKTVVEVCSIYSASDADKTRALYTELEKHGAVGVVAVNLFRSCKTSERAKRYRGGNSRGSFRRQAYDTKQWSMDNLCRVLVAEADALGIVWGWGRDENAIGFEDVLYIDTPRGQVSFHTERRGDGPTYAGQWDGVRHVSAERVCWWVSDILAGADDPAARAARAAFENRELF